MGFDEVLEIILKDARVHKIPILYVIEMVLILEDHNLFKEIKYEQLSE